VDFITTFDSVHRPSSWKILRVYGIPERFVEILKHSTETHLAVDNGFTTFFEITTGTSIKVASYLLSIP